MAAHSRTLTQLGRSLDWLDEEAVDVLVRVSVEHCGTHGHDFLSVKAVSFGLHDGTLAPQEADPARQDHLVGPRTTMPVGLWFLPLQSGTAGAVAMARTAPLGGGPALAEAPAGHFSLLVHDGHSRTWAHYDSLPSCGHGPRAVRVATKAASLLAQTLPIYAHDRGPSISVLQVTVPRQVAAECGLMAAAYAYDLARLGRLVTDAYEAAELWHPMAIRGRVLPALLGLVRDAAVPKRGATLRAKLIGTTTVSFQRPMATPLPLPVPSSSPPLPVAPRSWYCCHCGAKAMDYLCEACQATSRCTEEPS